MANFESRNFGNIEFDEASVVVFPGGLPGFEERRRFVALHFEQSAPLVYLQSLEEAELCFVSLPARAVDEDYQLQVSDEDLALIGLGTERQPSIGSEVLALAVLSIRETGTTANLLAPVVINVRTRTAVQAVMQETCYSHQYPLEAMEATAC
jgi:flagellar assembly factor FliW